MKILVTGAAGFMGSAFVKLFSEDKFDNIERITILDKLTYAGDFERVRRYIGNKIHFIHGDIADQSIVEQAMSKSDVCINYAAETHVDNSISNPDVFYQSNIIGTTVLLNAARKFSVSKFLQISTDEVYGAITEGEWDEESSLDPSSPYSASKLSADLIVKSYFKTYELPIVITRSCNNYGPGQNLEKLIPKTFTNALSNKKIPVYGTGANVREWLYVEDHARATYNAVIKGKPGETYNIGSGIRCTNLELIKNILKISGQNSDLIEFVQDRKGHDFRYALNSKRATEIIDFSPEIGLEEGLDRTLSYYQKLSIDKNEHCI
jgi:dTDP-glucose 4,6-dehydratase